MAELNELQQEEVKSPEEVLKEMRKNMVSKDQYDKLEKKYNQLYAETANGMFYEEEKAPEEPSEEEKEEHFQSQILAKRYGKVRGSYANMKLLLDVDDYLTSHGQRSCFAPSIGQLTDADDAMCSAMHDILKRAVDMSDGDDAIASSVYASSLTV